jgi:hypothetical protein
MGKSLQKSEGQEDNNKTLVVKENARALTAAEFHRLAAVPPAIEWFGNIRNEKTRRAYRSDVQDFMRFVGIHAPDNPPQRVEGNITKSVRDNVPLD